MKNRKGYVLLSIVWICLFTAAIVGIYLAKRIDSPHKGIVKAEYDTTRYITNEFEISADPYDLRINIIITPNTRKALTFVQHNTDSTSTISDFDNAVGVTFTGEGSPTIWIDSVDRSTESIAKANHELLHALFYIMRRANIKLTEDGEEAFTYEYDYLTSQFFKHIK